MGLIGRNIVQYVYSPKNINNLSTHVEVIMPMYAFPVAVDNIDILQSTFGSYDRMWHVVNKPKVKVCLCLSEFLVTSEMKIIRKINANCLCKMLIIISFFHFLHSQRNNPNFESSCIWLRRIHLFTNTFGY